MAGALLVALGVLLAVLAKGLRSSVHQADADAAPLFAAVAATFVLPGIVLWRGRWPTSLSETFAARVIQHRGTVQILTAILGLILIIAPLWLLNIGRTEGRIVMAVLIARYGAGLLVAPLIGVAALLAVWFDRKNGAAGRRLTLVVAAIPSMGSILGIFYGAYVYYWYWGQPLVPTAAISNQPASAPNERAV